MVIRNATYSFDQLRSWRNQAENIIGIPGVSVLDLDEVRNRVLVEISDEAARMAVENELVKHGVPMSAVVLRTTRAIVSQSETVRTYQRDLEGGLKIRRPSGAYNAGWCTAGFNAVRSGANVVIVNSHCVGWWGNQGWSVFGRSSTSPAPPDSTFHLISGETLDPWPVEAPCGTGCRYADAAVTTHTTAQFSLGQIAQTIDIAGGWGGAGSLDLLAQPYVITGTQLYSVAGQGVNKVGARTGNTFGYVTETCVVAVPIDHDPNYYACQDRASFYMDGGDSGSPVFIRNAPGTDNTVTLLGIAWGDNGETSVFSPLGSVQLDLGQLSVFTPPPPPPLTVYVSGPTDVQPLSSMCAWFANVSGGTQPYSYQWSGVKTGTGSSVWGAPGNPGWLYVQVNSADEQQANAEFFVNVYSEAPECEG